MPVVAKRILVGVAVAVAAVLLAALVAYLALRSRTSRERIERALTRILHAEVKIERFDLSPGGRLTARGVTAPQAGYPGNFLEVPEFTAKVSPWQIFSGRVEVEDVRVREPKVAWFQDEKGRWRLPEKPPLPPAATPPPATAEPAPAASPSAEREQPPGAPGQPPPKERGWRPEVVIHQAAVERGELAFFNRDGRPVFAFSGITIASRDPSPERVVGVLRCGELAVAQTAKFTGLESDFAYRGGAVDLTGLRAGLAGGTVDGDFHLQTEPKNSPFRGLLRFAGVDLAKLTEEAHWGDTVRLSGRLVGFLDAAGEIRDLERVVGSGQLYCEDGRLRSLGFLTAIGQLMGLTELGDLRFRRAQVDFRLGDKKIWIDYLVLDAGEIELSATGRAKMDGKLDLDARLLLAPEVVRRLPAFVGELFAPVPGSEARALAFDIKGTWEKPKSDFIERLFGRRVEEQAVDLLRQFLGAPPGKQPPAGQRR